MGLLYLLNGVLLHNKRSHIARKDNSRIPIIRTGWNIPRKTCGKTTTEMGRKYLEELLVAVGCQTMGTIKRENWLEQWRIKVNPTKSAKVTFNTRRDICPPVNLHNTHIPVKKEVKYLGLQLDEKRGRRT